MAISIKINGSIVKYQNEVSISDILKERNVRPEIVAVELNGALIDRSTYDEKLLKDGDQLEYLMYMAGGAFLAACWATCGSKRSADLLRR